MIEFIEILFKARIKYLLKTNVGLILTIGHMNLISVFG
jgi:hypothetical protein